MSHWCYDLTLAAAHSFSFIAFGECIAVCSIRIRMSHTRKQVNCPIIGSPRELSSIVLPTREDILRHYNWIRLQKENAGQYKPKMCEIYEEIAAKVEQIWNKASVPVLHRVRIISLIKREHEKLLNLLKSYHGRKKNFNFQHKVQAFKKEAKALFDVAACKCNDFELCHCEKSRKVPIKEQPFITDQRSAREEFRAVCYKNYDKIRNA
ncbi:hypothetical protein JTE90_007564 [Oedothorax gibbosus]|uniref:Uncharacterized protein n=1 Tax=Oedothorax gibbosus TaxID=931172 RepID=A0AAV6TLY0_9ARAC|nr:hypothetical protein JTE90_007564 [Oedothorax gibbosus]